MRFICAYEHELEKAVDAGLTFYGHEQVPAMARKMIDAAATGKGIIGESLKAACRACDIAPTREGIAAYID